MGRALGIFVSLVLFTLGWSGIAYAEQDATGCKDHPLFTRMNNFYIYRCEKIDFDKADFRDRKGKKINVEGRVYKIDYEIKRGHTHPSPLQVMRNYENAIKKIGGIKVFEDDYEIWLRLDKGGNKVWVHVDAWHGGGKGESYGVTLVEEQTMVQEVAADAKSLLRDIQARGSASVYGIYFDFDKADIKPESEPAIKEIARLLNENRGLKVYVVGHTDNVGSVDYNIKLSKARADAVLNELVKKHKVSSGRLKAFGVGSLAPVASNKTDEGRAKNRRVELVEQ